MPLESYTILNRIGKGKFCTVFRAQRVTDFKVFALKKVVLGSLDERARRNALAEAKLLRMMHHDHVVQLIEAFLDEEEHILYLVLELGEEGDLGDRIIQCQQQQQKLSEEELWGVVEQLSSALAYLHANNIIHRDIKPSNVLCFKGCRVKISDFNVSKIADHLTYTRTGTLSYASPEVWMGLPYDSKSDIWSLGCLLYELICLKKPFASESVEELFKKVTKCQLQKMPSGYSKELKDLITFMIQTNPKLRPSATTIHRMCIARKSAAKDRCRSRTRREALTPNLQLSLKDSHLIFNNSCLSSSQEEGNIVRKRLYTQVSKKHQEQAATLRKTHEIELQDKLERLQVTLKRSERGINNCFLSPGKKAASKPQRLLRRLDKMPNNRPRRNTDL